MIIMNILKKTVDNMKDILRTVKRIFAVRREERLIAILLLILIVALNALVVMHYYDELTKPFRYYWYLFIHKFHVSGFDPITYYVLTDWTAAYNVYRHPLLAFFMYPGYLINQVLIWLTGRNCAMFVAIVIQVFSAFYAMLFFRRIMRDIVCLDRRTSSMLTLFFFSFAYVMVSTIVPDHFIISMMLLMLTLWLAGGWMRDGREMTMKHTLWLFFITAGVSLNNGLKTFLASLFVNGKRFFRPKYLFIAVILPSALVWEASRLSYRYIVWPRDIAKHEANEKRKALKEKKAREKKEAQRRADSIMLVASNSLYVTSDTLRMAALDSIEKSKAKPKKKAKKRVVQGRPISNGEFMKWTDITTSRSQSLVENFFGESIQLHDQHLLEDELNKRPMIVNYSWSFNYFVEALIVLMFVVGVWCGRRSRFLWMTLSWFGLDFLLHVGLGFGLNEVYIMSAHWIFVIPIAVAFAIKKLSSRQQGYANIAVATLTAYLLIYNISLLVKYFV